MFVCRSDRERTITPEVHIARQKRCYDCGSVCERTHLRIETSLLEEAVVDGVIGFCAHVDRYGENANVRKGLSRCSHSGSTHRHRKERRPEQLRKTVEKRRFPRDGLRVKSDENCA